MILLMSAVSACASVSTSDTFCDLVKPPPVQLSDLDCMSDGMVIWVDGLFTALDETCKQED